MMEKRLRCEKLKDKLMTAKEAAAFVKKDMTIATSGFTPAGYPKAIPLELARRGEAGEKLNLTVITGASVGPEIDEKMTNAGVVARRFPYQTDRTLRQAINDGKVKYQDMHLSHVPQQLKAGFLGHIDLAIVEVVAITEEGHLVPSTSVGQTNICVEMADQVLVEINTSQPLELEGMHDITELPLPPYRKPIDLTRPEERIGQPYIECDPDKIVGIVECDIPDSPAPIVEPDQVSIDISKNIIRFLKEEVKAGRLPKNLLPLQSGVGNVANAVLKGISDSDFEHLTVYSEVLQDGIIDLLIAGKVDYASGTSFTLSPEMNARLGEELPKIKDKVVLRPVEISNNPGLIRRLGVIAINTALEFDIYGNVNSSHVSGTKMMNGLGGSGDFTRGGYLSIFTTQSTAKKGLISAIVPCVPHVDHTEHDVMVVVTEQGYADLRGLDPVERARKIIENCAHPDYKDQLEDYLNRAIKESPGQHTPHILSEAFSWYDRLKETGTMKIDQ